MAICNTNSESLFGSSSIKSRIMHCTDNEYYLLSKERKRGLISQKTNSVIYRLALDDNHVLCKKITIPNKNIIQFSMNETSVYLMEEGPTRFARVVYYKYYILPKDELLNDNCNIDKYLVKKYIPWDNALGIYYYSSMNKTFRIDRTLKGYDIYINNGNFDYFINGIKSYELYESLILCLTEKNHYIYDVYKEIQYSKIPENSSEEMIIYNGVLYYITKDKTNIGIHDFATFHSKLLCQDQRDFSHLFFRNNYIYSFDSQNKELIAYSIEEEKINTYSGFPECITGIANNPLFILGDMLVILDYDKYYIDTLKNVYLYNLSTRKSEEIQIK